MELYIAHFSELKVINTSKKGARIKGAPFMPLSDVLDEYLLEKQVVSYNWWQTKSHYSQQEISTKRNKMEQEYAHFMDLKKDVIQALREIMSDVQKQHDGRMERLFRRLDNKFKRMRRNDFYAVFIAPIMRVQAEVLAQKVSKVRFESDLLKKGTRSAGLLGCI